MTDIPLTPPVPVELLRDFLALSVDLTAFSEFDLRGTGQAEAYLTTVQDVVGDGTLGELLAAHRMAQASATGDEELARALRLAVFSDEKLGPVARNVIKLWYVGIWYELPPEWTETFGAMDRNTTFGVSAASYTEGLLWRAIGANPPGAKAPGYGSWAEPPRIDDSSTKGAPR